MTENAFEEHLSDLLTRRASQATIPEPFDPQPAGSNAGRQRYLLVAAIALMIAATGALLSLRSPTGAPLDEVASAAQADKFGGLVVWMDQDSPAQSTTAVDDLLSASPAVVSSVFKDSTATYAEFVAYYADSPEVLNAVKPADLPVSFVVKFVPSATEEQMEELLLALSAVDGVRISELTVCAPTQCRPSFFSGAVVALLGSLVCGTTVFVLQRVVAERKRVPQNIEPRVARQAVSFTLISASLWLVGSTVQSAARVDSFAAAVSELHPSGSYPGFPIREVTQMFSDAGLLGTAEANLYAFLIIAKNVLALLLLAPAVALVWPGDVRNRVIRNFLFFGLAAVPFLIACQLLFLPTIRYLTFVTE